MIEILLVFAGVHLLVFFVSNLLKLLPSQTEYVTMPRLSIKE